MYGQAYPQYCCAYLRQILFHIQITPCFTQGLPPPGVCVAGYILLWPNISNGIECKLPNVWAVQFFITMGSTPYSWNRRIIYKITCCRKLALLELQSIIGLLNHCCFIIPASRPFLHRLIDLTMGVIAPHHHIPLNKSVRADLANVAEILHIGNV